MAPILAGLDKFFHQLCNWDQYLAPWIARLSPIPGHSLMLVAGVIEIVAGVLVAFKPKIAAADSWSMALIIVNLVSMGSYLDVALRDLGLALGAFALWRLCPGSWKLSRSGGRAYTAASRHFGTYRMVVGRGESMCGEGEDLRIFRGDVAAVKRCKLGQHGCAVFRILR